MSDGRGTHRHWVFTLQKPSGLLEPEDFGPDMRYCIFQSEVGDDTGRHHFQGYVEFSKPKRLAGVRKLLDKAHWEPRRGTRDQARAYASKLDTRVDGPYEFGTWSAGGSGARTDISALKADIDSGKKEAEIWDLHPLEYLKYNRGIQRALSFKAPKKDWETQFILLVGPTGTGKSTWARERFGKSLYIKQRSNWWDQYDGEEAVLFDDFYGWVRFDDLLRLHNAQPFMAEVKGGQVQVLARYAVFTSNSGPASWYKFKGIEARFDSLARRFDKVLYFHSVGEFKEFNSYFTFDAWAAINAPELVKFAVQEDGNFEG